MTQTGYASDVSPMILEFLINRDLFYFPYGLDLIIYKLIPLNHRQCPLGCCHMNINLHWTIRT